MSDWRTGRFYEKVTLESGPGFLNLGSIAVGYKWPMICLSFQNWFRDCRPKPLSTQHMTFLSVSLPLAVNKQACHPFCHGHPSANKRSHSKAQPALWREHYWENQGYPLQDLGCVLTADEYRLKSSPYSALQAMHRCVCPEEIYSFYFEQRHHMG